MRAVSIVRHEAYERLWLVLVDGDRAGTIRQMVHNDQFKVYLHGGKGKESYHMTIAEAKGAARKALA